MRGPRRASARRGAAPLRHQAELLEARHDRLDAHRAVVDRLVAPDAEVVEPDDLQVRVQHARLQEEPCEVLGDIRVFGTLRDKQATGAGE